ncbi:hypothetical protein LOZ58_001903 [Ophidiomyces ophidiicola]|nr:hypothetical protein LOZ65_001797 [Ophidiomyces ophidiicola]KAI1943585.1 hypothetical protein LOZ66_000168 [Ophidiomyces ophidiicola]KAI1964041.1 hypothetical protein LOZ58_001903 [Ophidiomyces ophidiicola]
MVVKSTEMLEKYPASSEAHLETPLEENRAPQLPIIVDFEPGDKENPHNWSMIRKLVVANICVLLTLNSTLGSSMPAGSIKFIAEDFNVTNEYLLVLPISVFLIGYIVGPLFLAPLSEVYGRKPLLFWTFVLYLCFTLGTALAPNFPALLVLRFLAGTAAAAPLGIVGGLFADCFPDPVHRGRVMALWAAGTTFGPTLSPIISGFLGQVSWRWPFWFELIFGGVSLIAMLFLPETFRPVILAKRAARMRKELNRDDIVVPDSVETRNLKDLFAVTLTRPVTMLFTEPIVPAAYPIIFQAFGKLADKADSGHRKRDIGNHGCALGRTHASAGTEKADNGIPSVDIGDYRRATHHDIVFLAGGYSRVGDVALVERLMISMIGLDRTKVSALDRSYSRRPPIRHREHDDFHGAA